MGYRAILLRHGPGPHPARNRTSGTASGRMGPGTCSRREWTFKRALMPGNVRENKKAMPDQERMEDGEYRWQM
ncbi:hypothetical protein DW690_03720 [Dorea longicatena]|nr:hypothetical protein DW690_03720 [Dorea longicatena]